MARDDLAKLDVEYRRLMRMIVGPPADTNWASPWHEILHGWNNKVQVLSDYAGLKPWSVTCVEDVNFRRLLRSVVGPPSHTNWLNPWHEILHNWNVRVTRYIQEAGVLTWSQRSLQQYWHLPDARWVSRILVWRPRNTGKRGAPFRL